jgi:ubiquinone/menaquinone biosynthesis C-methylase UbiE
MLELQQQWLKEEVRRYWEDKPCNTDYTTKREGSIEWSDEMEERRYANEPFVHAFAQFTRWRGKRVLEIGCGAGTDCLQFARAGADMCAIDITGRAAKITQKRLAVNGVSASIGVGDAEMLPFEDCVFDLVYSWGVLHHTPDTKKAIGETHRVLKPGGRIVLMLYHRHSIAVYRKYLRYGLGALRPFRTLADTVASHVESAGTKAYSLPELRRMFHGFSDLILEPVLTPYDIRRLPAWCSSWLPAACGWFVVIRGCK